MKPTKRKLMIRFTIGILIVFCMSISVSARFLVNGSGDGYPNPGGEKSSGNSIKFYVAQGASFYLKGYSDIQTLLNLIELEESNGVNFDELNNIVDSAVFHMNNAVYNYDLLIKEAEVTPLDEGFKLKLMTFDYPGFAAEKGLNIVIFQECESYLKQGDVTGMFRHTHSAFIDILGILESVKKTVEKNNLPDLTVLWELNENCAELSLFGQYASRVFYEIIGK
ncbi:MAG: hypothetical protein KAW12_09975 [Candidatus Aminicenantes bacterium]|nr:hypothetical protein [Candidatus Aminicenantes bacterium]